MEREAQRELAKAQEVAATAQREREDAERKWQVTERAPTEKTQEQLEAAQLRELKSWLWWRQINERLLDLPGISVVV